MPVALQHLLVRILAQQVRQRQSPALLALTRKALDTQTVLSARLESMLAPPVVLIVHKALTDGLL
jgi:hypothetical protein